MQSLNATSHLCTWVVILITLKHSGTDFSSIVNLKFEPKRMQS